jgi:hypothetical protein
MDQDQQTCVMVKGQGRRGFRCGKPAAYVWNCGSRDGPLLVCVDCREHAMKNEQVGDAIRGSENFVPITPGQESQ